MKRIVISIVLIALLFVVGCTTSVKDINDNTDDYVGKPVVVTGQAVAPIKIGSLEGFTLQDDDASILVHSSRLPKHGDEVTVEGEVKKSKIIGTYIEADKVGFDE